MPEPSSIRRLLDDIRDRDAQTEAISDPASLPIGRDGTKYDHARRRVRAHHLDGPELAMGDRHVLLRALADASQRPWDVEDGTITTLGPRRFLIYAGKGRWIVTDREAPTDDEMRQWVDVNRGWGDVEGGPSIAYITECVPFDERLMHPVRWTIPSRPEAAAAVAPSDVGGTDD